MDISSHKVKIIHSDAQKAYNYVLTTTKHFAMAKHKQTATSMVKKTTNEQLDEYMDMTEDSKGAAFVNSSVKEGLEEYVEMNDKSKGVQNIERQVEEYVEVNQDCDKPKDNCVAYIDLETVRDYEVPVHHRKTSDLSYL